MTKDSTISFRANKELYTALAKVAKEEKRSISSLIDMALTGYLKERKAFYGTDANRRRYPRKTLSVPVVINQEEFGRMAVGSIGEISLGGVGVDIAKDEKYPVPIGSEGTRFELIFTLPAENKLIHMTCQSKRIVESGDRVHVGACFEDADFKSYQALQAYLM